MSAVERGRCLLLASVASLLCAPPAGAASISLDKSPVVLGRTESVLVTMEVDEPAGTDELPLRLSVNVGSFGEITRLGPGRYQAVYVPPETRFPQVALIGVWRETGPEAPIDFLRIPLYGTTRLPVAAKRGASIQVEVGGETFGPIIANARGKAAASLVVPPGVSEARVVASDRRGVTTQRQVKLEVPPYNRLTAALVPHAVVADGKSWVRLDVFYDLGGADVPATRISVGSSVGAVALERAEGGRYVYRYIPPAATDARQVHFSVSVQGDPAARASATLELGVPEPARVLLRPPSEPIVAGSDVVVSLEVLVLDAAGLSLPGQSVELTANGNVLPAPVDAGDGRYRVPFTPPRAYPPGGLVQLVTRARGRQATVSGTTNLQLGAPPTPKSVAAQVSPDPIPADGQTRAEVRLEVRDAAGKPVDHAELIAVASRGVLGPLEEEGNGVYRAAYTAPEGLAAEPTSLRIVDATGTFEAQVPIRLRPPPRRLFIGAQAGLTHGLNDQAGPRIGLDLWTSFVLHGRLLGAGLAASYGYTSQTVKDGSLESESRARYVPLGLRAGLELLEIEPLSVYVGAGAVLAIARVETSLGGAADTHVGFGATAFSAAWIALGPGHAFGELSYAWAPVSASEARLSTGGLGIALGYRLGLF